jgi:hypothetical protein
MVGVKCIINKIIIQLTLTLKRETGAGRRRLIIIIQLTHFAEWQAVISHHFKLNPSCEQLPNELAVNLG